MINFITAVIIILFAAFSRLIPHPMNFAPVAAIALFGGVYLNKKYAVLIPIAALVISDAFLGFYKGIEWVYGSFILIALIGLWMRSRVANASSGKKAGLIFVSTLGSSILFFLITNFGVWTGGVLYERTFSGLIQCFTMAIPFFRNSLIGDLFYVAIMFVAYELVARYVIHPNVAESKVKK